MISEIFFDKWLSHGVQTSIKIKHLYQICFKKTFSFRKHFGTVLKEEIRIAEFCTEVFLMPKHLMTKLNISESSLYMSPLRAIVFPKNIAELLWYDEILFFLLLYLTRGVVKCELWILKTGLAWMILTVGHWPVEQKHLLLINVYQCTKFEI